MGLQLNKSRARTWSYSNQLGYMLSHARSNFLIVGEHYELTLDQVERWLTDYARRVAARRQKAG